MIFTIHSAVRATLVIEPTDAPSGQVIGFQIGETRYHHAGLARGPLIEIFQPADPDEAWDISTDCAAARLEPVVGELPAELARWVPEEITNYNLLIMSLPPGDYELAIGSLSQCRNDVLLGNEWVRDQKDMVTIHQSELLYSAVISLSESDRRFAQSMVAVSILNYTGNALPVAALFLDLMPSDDSGMAVHEPVLLILPASGALVFDAMWDWQGYDSTELRERWKVRAADAADELANTKTTEDATKS